MLKWLPRWIAPRCARTNSHTRKSSVAKARKIRFECLEDRSVPSATLSINDVSMTEGNSGLKDFVFTVTLSEASASTVTVQYSTAEGTALDNSDFLRIPSGNQSFPTLTFAPGETSQTLKVRVKGDINPEADETFFVNLSNGINATILYGQGVGTILNDDSAPVANPDAYSVNEDTALNIGGAGILANDTDAQNEPLTTILVSGPSHGSLTLNADGSFSYSPTADYNGSDSFTYRASDSNLQSADTVVTITVDAVNDAPTFNLGANQTTSEDAGAQTVPGWATGMSAGPADEAGQSLEFVVTTNNPALFAVAPSVAADGTLTFTPAADANGQATVTVVLCDSGGTANGGVDSSPGLNFTISVTPVNDTPVAADDAYQTAEDNALTVSGAGVLANDTDADGDTLSAVVVSGPSHGNLTLNSDGSFTYTPETNYNGSDSFTYQANDGTVDSNVVTVNIDVTPVNDAPVAADQPVATDEDAAASGQVAASDEEGDSLTFSLVTGPAHGTLEFNTDGSFTYTPDGDYNGSDSFTYLANDGTADSNTATVTITVSPVNDLPVATGGSYQTTEDTGVSGQAVASDVDGDSLTYALAAGPAHGSLVFNSNGSFTYTPDANYIGPDSFSFTANDGSADSDAATVALTVTAVNDAPVLTGGAVLAGIPEASANPPGQTVAALFGGVFSDADGDTLAGIAISGNPQNADQGVWQYSTDGGTTWLAVGAVSDATALALGAGARIRFVPELGYTGDPSPLVVRAIDSTFGGSFTDGATRVTLDVTTAGGATAFSATTATIQTTVFDSTGAWLSTSGNLFVTGTTGNDIIVVRPSGTPGRLVVVLNGSVIGDFPRAQVTGRLRVKGLDGNDQITVSLALANPADLYGGAGADILWGGSRADRLFGEGGNDVIYGRVGNDVLVGGDGNDELRGGVGNDVLIGGAGADFLQGSWGSDLLIGGTTDFDANPTALSAIVTEWGSSSRYVNRIAHLTVPSGGLNGTTFLNSTTVHDDAAADILKGYYGPDWFWTAPLDLVYTNQGEVSAHG
jgi:VCBS repeat-containing protein